LKEMLKNKKLQKEYIKKAEKIAKETSWTETAKKYFL